MFVVKPTGKRGRPVLGYVCATHRSRPTACPVRQSLPMADIDFAVVSALTRDVLTPARLVLVLDDLSQQQREDAVSAARHRTQVAADLIQVDIELKNLTAAVASGANVATLLDGIRERETQRRGIFRRSLSTSTA
jgi:hypothetical protein